MTERFFRFLEEVQKKPEAVRLRILYVTTGILFLLIFMLWLSIFPSELRRLSETKKEVSPTSSPLETLSRLWSDTRSQVDGLKKDLLPAVEFVRESGPRREISVPIIPAK